MAVFVQFRSYVRSRVPCLYKDVWNPQIGEQLLTKQENENPEDNNIMQFVLLKITL